MMRKIRLAVLTLACAACLKAPEVLACPVCYGSSDDEILRGAGMSVLFMMGITYAMLLSGVAVVVVLYRRRRRQEAAKIETI